MSTGRRRSQRREWEVEEDAKMTRGKSRPLSTAKKLLIATAALFVLLLTSLFLISPFLHHDSIQTIAGLRQDGLQAEDESDFKLHPEDHVFRDASTIRHYWRLTTGDRRPDGVLKQVILVNDAFPGPTIEARSGDRLIIGVENAMGEGVSIHWHGLSMRDANDMDGAMGITNTPIAPGTTFTYDFMVEDSQHGTFWWHAHDGLQRTSLYGGLVVHNPNTTADDLAVTEEHLLLIGDWYHRSAEDALHFYMHPGAFGLETLPDSVLVNGQGNFTCTDAVPARPLDCNQIHCIQALRLTGQKKNVLRVVNVGAYAGFSISIPGAHIKPFAVDGGNEIQSHYAKSVGVLHPGERISLELSTKVNPQDLKITLNDEPFKYENPALTLTHRFPVIWEGISEDGSQPAKGLYETFDVQSVQAAQDQSRLMPEKADQTIVLYTITQKLAILENEPHGFINHTRWMPSHIPLIRLPREQWDEYQLVPLVEYNESSPLWVDIVLNNLDEDSHPFHLHGNDFWVLTKYSSPYNWGSYNPFDDDELPGGKYSVAEAVKKDTVYVPRRGYTILRFRADNIGIWMFHCHVLWHQASGMSMAFEVK